MQFFELATDHEPDAWQKDLLRSDAQRVLLLAARQVGKSTTVSALTVQTAVYQPDSLILMVSPSQRQSGELFRQAVHHYKRLGRPVAAEGENQSTLSLENGSRILSPRARSHDPRLFGSSDARDRRRESDRRRLVASPPADGQG